MTHNLHITTNTNSSTQVTHLFVLLFLLFIVLVLLGLVLILGVPMLVVVRRLTARLTLLLVLVLLGRALLLRGTAVGLAGRDLLHALRVGGGLGPGFGVVLRVPADQLVDLVVLRDLVVIILQISATSTHICQTESISHTATTITTRP